jgi:ABC-2 type transport system permease protein
MMRLLIKKEFLTAFRDVRFQISGGIIIVLMLTAVLVGRQGQKRIQQERNKAQSEMYDKWLNQGLKHPHSAAHYGQFAFKPKPVLSFIDIGLDNYTGISVFLEAHRQHEVMFSAAQDSDSMTRFGEMTVALILQVLIPLLIIFLTFNIFSREREEGTLKLIHAQGLTLKQLFMGKVFGTYIMVLLIFLPVILLAYLLLDQQSVNLDAGINQKFLILTMTYALYFLIFVILAVLISAFASSSGFSLLTLLGLWIACCIILPKATTSLADKIYPSPSQFEFKNTIKNKVKNGIDGHNPSDVRLASLKQQVLDQYGVKTIKELPVNWSGIAMQAGEEYTDQVYDAEFTKIEAIFKQQNELSEWAGFINPYLAVRNLSMALAGTDFHHHIAFARAAEDYRRAFVKKMNKDMEINHKPGIAYGDYKVGLEMWSSIKPFTYELPAVRGILANQWKSIAALAFWFTGLFLVSSFYAKKISIL